MEGSGVCVACGASGVELNDEQKCATCAGAAAAPEVVPAEAPAEGDMPAAEEVNESNKNRLHKKSVFVCASFVNRDYFPIKKDLLLRKVVERVYFLLMI